MTYCYMVFGFILVHGQVFIKMEHEELLNHTVSEQMGVCLFDAYFYVPNTEKPPL